MNVLITSASRKVGLVKAFKKALKGEGKVITIDMHCYSPAACLSDLNYIVREDSDPKFIPQLLSICKDNKVKLLIPSRDDEMKMFAENKEKFEKIGVKVVVPSFKTIKICSDKLEFVKFCQKNDFPVPKTYDIFPKKFPVFINNRFGQGSKDAHKVSSKEELEAYLNIIEYPIIQEYIDDNEYTIDLFVDFEGNIISVVPRLRIRTFGGESFVGMTENNKTMITEAINLAQKLELVGHNIIQCFFNWRKQEIKFIEINLRYGAQSALSFAAGANTPLWLIQLAKGKKLKSRIGKFKDKLFVYRYPVDVFKQTKPLRKNPYAYR